ncbi:MAG: hypothetical protein AB2L20_24335 [Mangrovibacterium sp.]
MNQYSAPVGLSYTREISLLTKATRGVKAIGGATIFIGGILDFGFGVPNYYKYGPGDPRSVSPGKAGLNLGVGVYSISLNPIVAPAYFGIDLFYPGGWPAAIQDQDRLIRRNQSILGPGWNMYKNLGGY